MTVEPEPRTKDPKPRGGVLYGVGVGSGSPELLTLQAIRVLKEVDVIAVPKSKEEAESRALSIIEKVVDLRDKEVLELVLPMIKDKDMLVRARRDAADILSERLRMGKDVAYATLGDPLFYSTFSYLMPLVVELLPGVNIRVIPGITSINTASARLLLPLAEADERVAIIPATYTVGEIKRVLKGFDTVILMKVNRVMDKVLGILDELDLKGKAIFISRAGWPEEVIIRDTGSLRGKGLDYLSMVVVKK